MINQTSNIDISIVIVNYKNWKDLRNCINSLDFKTSNFYFEIVVVDNHSDDGCFKGFQHEFPHVKCIQNSGNNGFANACNLGVQFSVGNYILFLNPDTLANQAAIYNMWQVAKKNPAVGIVSCLQKKPNGRYEKKVRKFPNVFRLFGLTRAIYGVLYKTEDASQDKKLFTDWVSGSVIFISKEWFSIIGGFNEDYWMYYEDVDLSMRVQKKKCKVLLLTSSELIHNHGGSSRINMRTTSETKKEVLISKHVYIHTHFQGVEKLISLVILVIYNLISKLLSGSIGILFFFIPKMRLNVYLLVKTVKYYLNSLAKGTWLSPNSMNYNKE